MLSTTKVWIVMDGSLPLSVFDSSSRAHAYARNRPETCSVVGPMKVNR